MNPCTLAKYKVRVWHTSAGRFLICLTFMLQHICQPHRTHLLQLHPRRYNIPTVNKSGLMILSIPGWSADQSAGLPEIAIYGGCSHDLKIVKHGLLAEVRGSQDLIQRPNLLYFFNCCNPIPGGGGKTPVLHFLLSKA